MNDPIVVSPTIQEWNGLRWYRCGNYFQRKGKRLHIAVYEAANGPVPKGHHVHHDDHDRANNRSSNLIAKPKFDHLSHHASIPSERRRAAASRNAREHLSRGNALLTTEQRSDAARRGWQRDRVVKMVICPFCGKDFEDFVGGHSKFCSNACKSAHRRASGVDDVTRICPACESPFTISRYSDARCCSKKCAWKIRKEAK